MMAATTSESMMWMSVPVRLLMSSLVLWTSSGYVIRSNRGSRISSSKFDEPIQSNPVSTNSYLLIDEMPVQTTKHTWWDLFQDGTSGGLSDILGSPPPQIAAQRLKPEASIAPTLGAWKSVGNDETMLTPPGSLKDFLSGKYALGESHVKKIDELWSLVKNRGSVKHLDESASSLVVEALKIAYIALWGKRTMRSLEIAINRARGIASVLGELNASVEVVLAGILHEVISDLGTANEFDLIKELEHTFSREVIALASQYGNLPRFMARKTDYTPLQSENQLQMLVVSAADYRTLYIRLADRLHTLRVLKSLPLDDEEKMKIAEEALYLYAPLAHRMNVMKVKGELEDLSFSIIDPDSFRQTRYTQIAANKAYMEAHDKIQEIITKDPVVVSQNATFLLRYRIKDKYQIFLKMKRKKLKSLSDVRDALGLRIILDPRPNPGESAGKRRLRGEALCYYIVERLKTLDGWEPSAGGSKDYIRGKKENGYQSLHQYIRNLALGTNVEVQVRTREMHINAELGEAAHWSYKDQIYRPDIFNSRTYKQAWRSPEQLKANSSAELFGLAKSQLLRSRVFVYLEDMSTVLNLKKGATALDAAFAIHTNLGLQTKSIKVGAKTRPLDYVLKLKDVVSVTRTEDGKIAADPSWFSMLKTNYAHAYLRKYFKEPERRGKIICLGLVQILMTLSIDAGSGRLFDKLSAQLLLKKSGNGNGNILYASDIAYPAALSLVDDAAGAGRKVATAPALVAVSAASAAAAVSSGVGVAPASGGGLGGSMSFVASMAKWARDRTGMALDDLLFHLGSCPDKAEATQLLSRLFHTTSNVDPSLWVSSLSCGMVWAGMQKNSGWEDREVRDVVLLPMLRTLLPALNDGLANIEKDWHTLFGSDSFLDAEEQVQMPQHQHLHLPDGSMISQADLENFIYAQLSAQVNQVGEQGHRRRQKPVPLGFDVKKLEDKVGERVRAGGEVEVRVEAAAGRERMGGDCHPAGVEENNDIFEWTATTVEDTARSLKAHTLAMAYAIGAEDERGGREEEGRGREGEPISWGPSVMGSPRSFSCSNSNDSGSGRSVAQAGPKSGAGSPSGKSPASVASVHFPQSFRKAARSSYADLVSLRAKGAEVLRRRP